MNLIQKLAVTGTLLVALVGNGCTQKPAEPKKDPYESSKKVAEFFQRDLPEGMCEAMRKTMIYPLAEIEKEDKDKKQEYKQDKPEYK